jgi:DNA transposition AAA+ family ATPase
VALLLADVSAQAQLVGLALTLLTVVGIVVGGFYVSRSKAREVAESTAVTWKSNAEAERAERLRLQEQVDANRRELEQVRRDAPDLKAIAHVLEGMEDRLQVTVSDQQKLSHVMARMDQSLELIVRELGERRRAYRGPVELDSLADPSHYRRRASDPLPPDDA